MINDILFPVLSLGSLGLIFGVSLAIASRVFYVKKDPRVEKIREALPGGNCGMCGYPGCDSYAEAVASGLVDVGLCPVGGDATTIKLGEIMGVEVHLSGSKVADIECKGDCEQSVEKYEYAGLMDCRAAKILSYGPKTCHYGCLGMGSCVKVCPFGAMRITEKRLVEIDREKCTGCGKCVSTCPRYVIKLIPRDAKVSIACSTKDRGKTVRQVCKVGCIGCKICEKSCKFEAITIEDNLPAFHYDKCVGCMVCMDKCPANCIIGDIENRKTAIILKGKCTGCTVCKKVCQFGAIEGERKQLHVVDPEKCTGCGLCAERCPFKAIEME